MLFLTLEDFGGLRILVPVIFSMRAKIGRVRMNVVFEVKQSEDFGGLRMCPGKKGPSGLG